MYNAIVYVLGLLVLLFLAYLNTPYHPKRLLKRYVEIKNPAWARLLILNGDPGSMDRHRDNVPEHRNKLLYTGLVFYVLWGALVIASPIVRFAVPEIAITPLEIIDTWGPVVDTANEKFLWNALFALAGAELTVFCLNLLNCAEEVSKGKRVMRALWIAIVAVLAAATVAMVLILCGVPLV